MESDFKSLVNYNTKSLGRLRSNQILINKILSEELTNKILYLLDDYETWVERKSKNTVGLYEGVINNNMPNGYGVLSYTDGERYEGEWREGKRHGHGVNEWPSGQKYEGEFREGKRHGYGVFSFPSGERYEGEWKEGNFLG